MSALNKGQRVADRYVLLSRLGQSAHAEVWLAQDLEALAKVVIKLAVATGEEAYRARRLLANEFETGRHFNHPSIVRYYDFVDDEQLCYLTQEYLPDGSLASLKQKGWHRYLPGVAELCDALAHVHANGYVHRDVKLGNALYADDGRVKLIDFGVASVAGPDGLRSGGTSAGSSPQQLDGAPPAPADDVYAVGALLHELIHGGAPGQGHDGHAGVPDEVHGIVTRMLDADPARRPADLAVVARRFEALLDAEPDATAPPEEFAAPAAGAIAIEAVEALDGPSSSPSAGRPSAIRRGLTPAMGVFAIWYLVFAVAAVFYYLPKLAPEVSATVRGATPVAGEPKTGARVATGAAAPAVEPWKLAQLARIRGQAEERLEQLLEKQFQLDEKKIDVWAAEEYAEARSAAIEGDKAFRLREYEKALAEYTRGDELLASLVERSANLVDENIALGEARVGEGNGVDAQKHFELVLRIEPDNARAAAGLERAQQIDEVTAMVEKAGELGLSGDRQEALTTYREAVAIDGAWQPAKEGVARMYRALAGSRFNAAMSKGYAALESGRYDAARAAFDSAEKMRPGAREVTEARAQLAMASQASDIGALRTQAESLEAEGNFTAARDRYQAALALDENLAFARDGAARLSERIELTAELNAYLKDPDRLSSDSVYRAASGVLDRARAVASPWPALGEQVERLESALELSRSTSIVRLVSDNQTNVLVYRVGRLGRFEQTELELRPGTYTVIGSRSGYRDVRRQFRVAPGADTPVVDVRCEERI